MSKDVVNYEGEVAIPIKIRIIAETEDYVLGTSGSRRSNKLPSALVNSREEKQQQMSHAELRMLSMS